MSVCIVVRERRSPIRQAAANPATTEKALAPFSPEGAFLEPRIFSEELVLPSADQGVYPRVR